MTDLAKLGFEIDASPVEAAAGKIDAAFAKIGTAGDAAVARVKKTMTEIADSMNSGGGGVTGRASGSSGGITDANVGRLERQSYVSWWKDAVAEKSAITKQADAEEVALSAEAIAYHKRLAQTARQTEKMFRDADLEDARIGKQKSLLEQQRDLQEHAVRARTLQQAQAQEVFIYQKAGAEQHRQSLLEQQRQVQEYHARTRDYAAQQSIMEKRDMEMQRQRWKDELALRTTDTNNSISSITSRFAEATWQWTRVFYGITALVGGITAPAAFGISFQKEIEDSKVGITGILVSMTNLNGKAMDFQNAWRISGDVVNGLYADSIKYGISLSQITNTYRAILAPGLGAGMDMSQIKSLASMGSVAVSAIGLPAQQMVQEIRDLVTGGIQASQNTLATALGITAKDILDIQRNGGDLFAFLNERLRGFADVAEQTRKATLSGSWDILMSKLQMLLSDQGGFDALKKSIQGISAYIGEFNQQTGKMEFNPRLVEQVTLYWNALKVVGAAVSEIASITASILPIAVKVGEAFLIWKAAGLVAWVGEIAAGWMSVTFATSAATAATVEETLALRAAGVASAEATALATGAATTGVAGVWAKIGAMGLAARGGLIGVALFGAYEVADYFGLMDGVFDGVSAKAEKAAAKARAGVSGKSPAEIKTQIDEMYQLLDQGRNREYVQAGGYNKLNALEEALKAGKDELTINTSIAAAKSEREANANYKHLADAQAHEEKIADIQRKAQVAGIDAAKNAANALAQMRVETKQSEMSRLYNVYEHALGVIASQESEAPRALKKENEEWAKRSGARAEEIKQQTYHNSLMKEASHLLENATAKTEALTIAQKRMRELGSDPQFATESPKNKMAVVTSLLSAHAAEEKVIAETAAEKEFKKATKESTDAMLEFVKADDAMQNSAAKNIEKQQLKTLLIGKDKQETELLTEQYRIAFELQDNLAKLRENKAFSSRDDNSNEGRIVKHAFDLVAQGYVMVSAAAQEASAKEIKSRHDAADSWSVQGKKSITDYMNFMMSAGDLSAKLFTGAMKNSEDALVSFVKTGKLNFKSMIDSFLSDLARYEIQQSIMKPIVQSGGVGGLIGSLGSVLGFGTMPQSTAGGVTLNGSIGSTVDGSGTFVGMLSSLTGARASGGPVDAGGLYRVNELGPEVLSVGGNDYLMMGGKGGNVTPNSGGGKSGGGTSVTLQVNVVNNAGNQVQATAAPNSFGGIDVIIAQIENAIGGNIVRGTGAVNSAITQTFGVNRAAGAY